MGFIKHIKEEFQVIQERDPAIKTPLEVLLYPSFRVMIQYRKAHKLYQNGDYEQGLAVSFWRHFHTFLFRRLPADDPLSL